MRGRPVELTPEATWSSSSLAVRRGLAQRARWAVFATVVANPGVPGPELTKLVRASFAERGIPIDGHDLRLTLRQLIKRGQIENVGNAARPLYTVAADVEERHVERVMAARAADRIIDQATRPDA